MKSKLLILLLASALAASLIVQWRERPPVAAPVSAESEWTRIFDNAGKHPSLAAAQIGVCVLDAKGEVLFEKNAHTAFIPASSLKTVTTATALEMMGPGYRFETKIQATAAQVGEMIDGDLVLVGGANPMLSMDDLKAMAGELQKRGLRRISGRIIGDGSFFKGSIYDDFWNWGDIGNGYGSGVSGLNLEHNRYVATFDSGNIAGMPAAFLGAQPEVPGVKWVDEVRTGEASSGDGVVIHGGEQTGLIHLRGTVPLGSRGFTVVGAVPDPEVFAAYHFREMLRAGGIQVDGEAVSFASLSQGPNHAPVKAEVSLSTHRSQPLIEIIASIHETSDNHETDCVFRLLGLREGKAPDAVVRDHWRARGLEFEGLRMEDGCGLARADFIRPLDLAKLQYLAGRGTYGAMYRDSLLSKDEGRLRWKGGAMSGVRSTTGYLIGNSGEEYAFAFMVNHYSDASAVAELREALISAMRER